MYSNPSFYHYDPYYNSGYYRVHQDTQLVSDIEKAINGEYSATICYEQLAKMAHTENARNQILEIRQDEIRHFEEFSKIYTNLTGRQPTPNITEECKKNYKAGLEASFKDEQETVDFYLDIADRAKDQSIKEIFRRAAADEQNHAVWFLYFLNKKDLDHRNRQGAENYGAKGALNATALTLEQMLIYAMQDEYLAQARYDDILQTFGYVRTFARIKEAELRHIDALSILFDRYQIPIPNDISNQFVTTPETIKDAFAAGVSGEIDNIAMYEKFLSYDIPQDMRMVFTQLRNASRNHLTAFERGLER